MKRKGKKLAMFCQSENAERYSPKFGPADGLVQLSISNFVASQTLRNDDVMSKDPAEAAEATVVAQEIRKIIEGLPERDAKVIRLRYGIGPDGSEKLPMTLKDIAKELGVSRERVRCIEENALLKLRRLAKKAGLIESRRQTISDPGLSWAALKPKTDLLGDVIPAKPYIPRTK